MEKPRDDRPETSAENRDHVIPLTESERTPRESLSDLIPEPDAERPEGDGQDTPPIAP